MVFVETTIRKAESLLKSFKEPFKQVHRGAWHICVGAMVGMQRDFSARYLMRIWLCLIHWLHFGLFRPFYSKEVDSCCWVRFFGSKPRTSKRKTLASELFGGFAPFRHWLHKWLHHSSSEGNVVLFVYRVYASCKQHKEICVLARFRSAIE